MTAVDPTPTEALSTQLVDCLIKEGLVRADKRDALVAKIATGAMKGQDWQLEIDLAQVKAVKK